MRTDDQEKARWPIEISKRDG